MLRISLRIVALDIPPQDVITRDNISLKVNAVVYFRVIDPNKAVVGVENYLYATSQLAQTTLRSVVGQSQLDEFCRKETRLTSNSKTSWTNIQSLGGSRSPWWRQNRWILLQTCSGPLHVRQRQRGRRRAKVIHAEGEAQAAQKLAEAANIISVHPAAMHLRFLQTLTEVSTEKNSTVILPLPIDLLKAFLQKKEME